MIIAISGKKNSGKDTVGKIIQILTESPHFTNQAVLEFLEKPVLNSKWEIKRFADKLKDIVCLLLGCTREQLEDREFKEKELGEEWWYYKFYRGINDSPMYPYLKPYVGNENLKGTHGFKHPIIKLTPRLLLQLLGTECGRQILHPNIWVNALMSEYKPDVYRNDTGHWIWAKELKLQEDSHEEISKIYPIAVYPNWIITDMRFPNELEAVKKKEGITIRVNRPHKSLIASVKRQVYEVEHESEKALDSAEFDYVIVNDGSLLDLIEKVREILTSKKLI